MSIQLHASARQPGTELPHFWSVCVEAGRANGGLRAGWLEQMRLVLEAADIGVLDWQPVWVREFLSYCDREKLPVDFVSCHPYRSLSPWSLIFLMEEGAGS